MPLPNFLIIGVAKAGTTSLYYHLRQHPQIYLSPIKEPEFLAFGEMPFNFKGPGLDGWRRVSVATLADYQTLFDDARDEIALGEASVNSRLPRACERIQTYLPDAKLIIILRQPADRAYSNFLHMRRLDLEPLDFMEALQAEEERRRQGWLPWFWYGQRGYYHADLQKFLDRFPREQIRVYLHDDWQRQPLTIIQDIFRFLGVDDQLVPDISVRYNTGQLPRSQRLLHFLKHPDHPLKNRLKPLVPPPVRRHVARFLHKANLTTPPLLDPQLRRQLTERYRDDIRRLETLIERDLSAWLA